MSYLNQVIRRTAPMTPAQCAVYALLGSEWVGVKWIFDAGPLYLESEKHLRARRVGYGTIGAILMSLEQQGYAQSRPKWGRKRGREYRRAKL